MVNKISQLEKENALLKEELVNLIPLEQVDQTSPSFEDGDGAIRIAKEAAEEALPVQQGMDEESLYRDRVMAAFDRDVKDRDAIIDAYIGIYPSNFKVHSDPRDAVLECIDLDWGDSLGFDDLCFPPDHEFPSESTKDLLRCE